MSGIACFIADVRLMASGTKGAHHGWSEADIVAASLGVAVATCQGGEFISQQLEPILSQDPPPDQVVIADDCSSDLTIEQVDRVLRKWAALGDRVRVLEITQRQAAGQLE